MTATVLRVVAIAIAIAAFIDPAFAVHRAQPPTIDVRIGVTHASDARASEARERILDGQSHASKDVPAAGSPSAVVLIAPSADDLNHLPAHVPISVVELEPLPGVRVLRVHAPKAVLPGQTAVVSAEIEASGHAGVSSVITLEQEGVELARASLSWRTDRDTQTAALTFAPPEAGIQRLRVVVRSTGGAEGDAVDVPVIAQSRELRVMNYEPRPSWGAAFVRRALEADPVFASASFARASRGVEVRAGSPPQRLTADALESFDAVIVGAPEVLSAAEVQVLDSFARTRGGAVILLPDRRPSGPYTRLLPVEQFDEVLVETPLAIEGSRGIKATELALPRDLRAAATVLASARLSDRMRPAIVSWPLGAGRLVFSGALDAWRYRADNEAAFGTFWTGLIANLAASAPRALEVTVHPALAAPGERVVVRAALRQTEWTTEGDRTELPAIGAAVVAADGASESIRLWPTAEPGTFEGYVTMQSAGRFDVRASAGALRADAPIVVAEDLRKAHGVTDGRPGVVARSTGGVVVTGSDLGPLDDHLRGLRPAEQTTTLRPMRSAWWIVAFAGALCAEWTLRRRQGLR